MSEPRSLRKRRMNYSAAGVPPLAEDSRSSRLANGSFRGGLSLDVSLFPPREPGVPPSIGVSDASVIGLKFRRHDEFDAKYAFYARSMSAWEK